MSKALYVLSLLGIMAGVVSFFLFICGQGKAGLIALAVSCTIGLLTGIGYEVLYELNKRKK